MRVVTLLLPILLSGCTLIPKPVEYFQDRVQPAPEYGPAADESLRQAAKLAATRAEDTERAAIATDADPAVLNPAQDTSRLTGAVSARLGPPVSPWQGEIDSLIARMNKQQARLERELASYRESIRSNVGKPIEGTGAIRLPYFGHLLLVLALAVAAWGVLRIVAAVNAPVSVGLKTIQGSSRFLGRSLAEVVEAGQDFKNRLRNRFRDQPDLAESILDDFRDAHRTSQSRDVQRVVGDLKA